jgi:predicted regulator of Ras-like GTPase activity (Roadblock/LC7/MglB family)
MPEDRDDDVDVDSLFDGIDSEAEEAEKKVHAAITMRPLGIKKNDPPGAANRFAVAQRSELLKAGMTTKSSDADTQMAAVGGAAVVLGVASRTVGGVVSTAGAMSVRLEERAAYLARLAAMVGEELGLETLRELHLGGGEQRLAWVARPDGSASTIVAQRETDMGAVARKLRR